MNLRALRTFVTTAEVGGLGRACVRLNISQPAASRHIHALEYELGEYCSTGRPRTEINLRGREPAPAVSSIAR